MFLSKKQIVFLFAAAIVLFISAVSFFSRGSSPELFGEPTVGIGGAGQELVFPVRERDSDLEIRNSFQAYLQSDIPDGSWTFFGDSTDSVTPGQFLRAVGGDIDNSLEALLDPQELQLYTCTANNQSVSERHAVLSVRFALQENYQGDFFRDQLLALTSWEQSLVSDIQPVLFPNQILLVSDSTSVEFTNMQDGGYTFFRTATVSTNDGETVSIYYMMIGDEVLIGNSESCILRAQQLLFDLSA